MKRIFFWSLLVAIAVVSCKPDDPNDVGTDLGYDYYPYQRIGSKWIYAVDSLVYDDNSGSTQVDTFRYQYMEEVGSEFTDDAGITNYQILRYYKFADSLPWVQVNAAVSQRNSLRAERVDENVRTVKLVFPPTEGKRWNGNMFNANSPLTYRIQWYEQPYYLYDQTIYVEQIKENNFIDTINRYEVYARNIGLVWFFSDSINTQETGSRGYRFTYRLMTHIP
ncbi:MAG: hypothetical protein MUE96_12040 [Bacteroidia bacterium]|jgi:hypothetical protein|nr:hypothetical protein [Bacteroidia bacterium]